MRKLQLSILIVLGVLIFGITSCGNEDTDDNEIVQENPPKPDTPPDPTTPDKTDSDDRNLSLYEMILGTVKNIGDDIDDSNDPEEPVDPIEPNKEIETFTETVNGVSFDMVAVDGEQKFWIGRHEVTQKLWKAVMGTSPSRFHGDEMPVEKVSWNDAQTFVLKLTQLTGHSYRLPSLREWSYAAKGGSTPKGYKYSGSDNLNEVAWYYENSNSTTHEVGKKKCNELEIFDMSGNVSEWCAGGNDKERYAIGGSWYNFDDECDLKQVRTYNSNDKGSNLGFRLALSSKEQKAAPKILCRLSNPDEIYKDSPLSVEVRSDIACNISIKVDGKNIDSQDNISVLITDVATNEVGRHIITITATVSGNIQTEEIMEYVVIGASILSIEKFRSIICDKAANLVFDIKNNVNTAAMTATGKYVDENECNLQVYTKGTDYYVISENNKNIFAPEDCSGLFKNLEIQSIVFNNFDTRNVKNVSGMFYFCSSRMLDLSKFNTENIEDMSFMFAHCRAQSINLSNFDTHKVRKMNSMFSGCNNLENLDLSCFNTENVLSMESMFENCRSLQSLNISNFNTKKVSYMSNMFYQCVVLRNLDVSSFDTKNVMDMSNMFENDFLLTSLDLTNFDTRNVKDMSYMFRNCKVLKTVYASSRFVTSSAHSDQMFYGCVNILGGFGTKYNINNIDCSYAHVDLPNSPGYFTNKFLAEDLPSFSVKVNDVSFDMVRVEGGTFQMGDIQEHESIEYDREKPVHYVTLNTFFVGRYEVTQELWKAVMGNNPSHFIGDLLPVESVSWEDVQVFISKLNTLTSMNFRLPTEAEWEFAARGGNRSLGFPYSGGDKFSDVAWYECSKTYPVGLKQGNELDLYDMTGNVIEWCSDWYGVYRGESQYNPLGPDTGEMKVARGSGWRRYGAPRISHRYNFVPDYSWSDLGFRLAL